MGTNRKHTLVALQTGRGAHGSVGTARVRCAPSVSVAVTSAGNVAAAAEGQDGPSTPACVVRVRAAQRGHKAGCGGESERSLVFNRS